MLKRVRWGNPNEGHIYVGIPFIGKIDTFLARLLVDLPLLRVKCSS